LKHAQKLKEALQIAGIYSTVSCFRYRTSNNDKGTQIDMIIDRTDQTVNLCEMKFYNQELTLTKDVAEELRRKLSVFQTVTKTKNHVFITLVTTYGIHQGIHSIGLIGQSLTIQSLF
jgi:hypothetical protein